MPLQNRVTPFGEIVATPARGTMMGNRGILHDERRQLVRRTQLRRWICCVTSWKGIRRTVMTPHRWTELFFLDEATALAAGHRPCFECRRADALAFQEAWRRVFGDRAKADAMDLVLEAERRVPRTGAKVTYEADASSLPDGAMMSHGGDAWLVWGDSRWLWTPAGYAHPVPREREVVHVLTPRSTTKILGAGYVPRIHPSAGAASTRASAPPSRCD